MVSTIFPKIVSDNHGQNFPSKESLSSEGSLYFLISCNSQLSKQFHSGFASLACLLSLMAFFFSVFPVLPITGSAKTFEFGFLKKPFKPVVRFIVCKENYFGLQHVFSIQMHRIKSEKTSCLIWQFSWSHFGLHRKISLISC